jgi:hypothetical protein
MNQNLRVLIDMINKYPFPGQGVMVQRIQPGDSRRVYRVEVQGHRVGRPCNGRELEALLDGILKGIELGKDLPK